ncbi:MAG TPA: PLDc N-terminal domain-containing protein [Thermoanaerobaculia bacterium]|nr:PLDc N-terminal domain-containing protein [Thermoanaerobaculia bacterium]
MSSSSFPLIYGNLGLPELLVVGALLSVWIVLLVFVYRDAARHGMNAGFWAVIVFFLHLLGLVVYLVARGTRGSQRG